MSHPSNSSLKVDYASPANAAFGIDTPLPSASAAATTTTTTTTITTADKTSYLSALRAAVTDAQATINRELTARMEEDKARDSTSSAAGAAGVDDEKEEENYGEEAQEEED